MYGVCGIELCLRMKNVSMAKQIVRMGALNCFEVLISMHWHFNVVEGSCKLVIKCKQKNCDQ
jgi:hypothetical protein